MNEDQSHFAIQYIDRNAANQILMKESLTNEPENFVVQVTPIVPHGLVGWVQIQQFGIVGLGPVYETTALESGWMIWI